MSKENVDDTHEQGIEKRSHACEDKKFRRRNNVRRIAGYCCSIENWCSGARVAGCSVGRYWTILYARFQNKIFYKNKKN